MLLVVKWIYAACPRVFGLNPIARRAGFIVGPVIGLAARCTILFYPPGCSLGYKTNIDNSFGFKFIYGDIDS